MKRSARVAASAARTFTEPSAKVTKPIAKVGKAAPKAKPRINNKVVESTKSIPAGNEEESPYFQAASSAIVNTTNDTAKNKLLPKKGTSTKVKMPKTVNNSVRLGRNFYDQDAVQLCQALLGTVLCRKVGSTVLRGTIIETEAYPGGEDKASQSYQGRRTPRNLAMYMDPGTAYVYFTYGMYFCFNISSKGEGSACLIRGVEPHEDYDMMHQFRSALTKKKTNAANDGDEPHKQKKRLDIHQLANGPSKLCIAFDISRDKCDQLDMVTSDEMWLEINPDLKYKNRDFEVALDKRIGIESTPPEARNKLWRFYVKGSWAESRAKIGELKKKAKEDSNSG